jgi:hypothetical protein
MGLSNSQLSSRQSQPSAGKAPPQNVRILDIFRRSGSKFRAIPCLSELEEFFQFKIEEFHDFEPVSAASRIKNRPSELGLPVFFSPNAPRLFSAVWDRALRTHQPTREN